METFKFSNGPIEEFSWGKFIVFGKKHYRKPNKTLVGSGKDIQIVGDEISHWRERKGHILTEKMIEQIFNFDVEILIIGNGVYGSLEVPNTLVKKIKDKGIDEIIVKKTPEACQIYNEFYLEGKFVAFLAHGTC